MDVIYRYDPFAPIVPRQIPDAKAAIHELIAGNDRLKQLVARMQDRTLGGDVGDPIVIPMCPLNSGLPLFPGAVPSQAPFAAVLGCSDARVPTEAVFDQSFNDLFVLRIAGNVLGSECLGSLHYALETVKSGEVDWMIPLRSAVRGMDEGQLMIKSIGHQLYFINRGVLHAISPVERRIVWTRTVGDHTDGVGSGRHSSRPSVSAMLTPGGNDGGQSLVLQRAHTTGSLAVVQPQYLCVYGRRSLSILDPRTGEPMWELDGLSMNAIVVGSRDMLFVIHPGKEEATAYRALDGKPVEVSGAARLVNNAISVCGSSLLLLEQVGANPLKAIGIRRARVQLRLHDPVAGTNTWKLEFPPRTLFSPLNADEVIALQTDGQVQRIQIATGRTTAMESIPIDKTSFQRERYLLADDDQIYLVVNSVDTGHQSYGENLASIRVNGTIHAWNRRDNRIAWHTHVKHQNLVVDRFSTLPVLLCVSRSWKQRGRANLGIGTLNITAVHKQTGNLLIDKEIPSAYSGFHAVSLNADEPSIDLKSYNMRMRLVPEDGPMAAAPQPDPPAKAN